jgi:hypothetical protein
MRPFYARFTDRPLEFFPSRDATDAERLDAVIRFVVYASVAVSVYRQDVVAMLAGIAVIGSILVLFPGGEGMFGGSGKKNVPTPDNPFTNVLANEYSTSKARPSSTHLAQVYFDRGLPREISDVYHKRASDRQFVTMPVTDNIPDTLAFRNFLYGPLKK